MTNDVQEAGSAVTLSGRYRLDTRIAVGGMGEVWHARDLLLDRDVAVKLLKDEYLEDSGFLQRFRAEARHTAGLSHPGIATVYDYGEVNGAPFLVMELVRGEPLSAIIAAAGALPISRALDIAAQTARALGAAHAAGVVHRDVKPGNILVCPDGTVKVTDFGIARAVDAVPLTQTGTVVGTATYLSPEQARGAATVPASDLYSLGVVTYEMVAGYRPFVAANPVAVALAHLQQAPDELPADIPEPVRALVLKSLEKRPEDRHDDAASFAAAAEHAAAVDGGLLPAGPLPVGTAVVDGERTDVTRVLPVAPVGAPAATGPTRLARRWLALLAVPVLMLAALALNAKDNDNPTRPATAAAALPSGTADAAPTSSPTPTASAIAGASPTTSPSVLVPGNLFGKSYADAAAIVTRAQLRPARRSAESREPAGTVIGIEPKAGTPLAADATVTLVTSAGPPPAVQQPPNDEDDDERGRGKGKKRNDD